MSILKLTYIAHGKYLAKTDTPLFTNEIQAWRYGPVIVDVYHAFCNQGLKVSVPLPGMPDVVDPSDTELLEEVWDEYGKLPPFKLSRLTHVPGGPWDIAVDIGGWYAEIPDKLIRLHYAKGAET